VRFNQFIFFSKQSVTNPFNTATFIFTSTWLHVSACTVHHSYKLST